MDTVTLQSDLGIESSAGLKDMLAAHVDVDAPIAVDGAGVQRVHTASLQVLCSFVRQREQAGLATDFSAVSQSFRDAARLLGVGRELGLPATDNNINTQQVENAA